MSAAKWKDLNGVMKVELDVGLTLEGGSVLVSVANETQGVRLTRLVTELIESREGRFGIIGRADVDVLDQAQHEMRLAASLLASRVDMERSRAVGRGEA